MQAIRLVNTLDMSSNEWLKHRRDGIGGSDSSVIMGINPWRSPMDLWLEKTEQYTEDIDSEAMYWGRVLEDVVSREFVIRNKTKVRRINAILQHPDYPFMIANLDRVVVGKKEGLEIKTGHEFSAQYWNDEVPAHYYAQVQHYMAVTSFKVWHIAALIGGNKYKQFKVLRNENYIKELIKAEQDFWELVQTGQPPELDGSEASARAVSRLYPEAKEGEIDLPPDAFSLVQQYEEAAGREKAAKLEKDEAANKLKAMLGDAERGTIYDRKVSWTNVSQSRFDGKAFQKDHEGLYKDYCRESTFRRFSIK